MISKKYIIKVIWNIKKRKLVRLGNFLNSGIEKLAESKIWVAFGALKLLYIIWQTIACITSNP